MKKLNQISNILFLVAFAFFVKAYLDRNISLVLVGLLLVILGAFRRLLIKQANNMNDEPVYQGEDSIIRYLKEKPILYAEMLTLYRRGNSEILYEENDGILLYDHTTHEYLATASTLAGATDIILKLPDDYGMLITHDDVFLKLENKYLKYSKKAVFYNHVYEKRAKYKIFENNLSFKMLDEYYIKSVKEHYDMDSYSTDAYIESRIKEGMLGAFIEDKLVGFIGMHDNGSIGMLEVFEAYRNKHIGMLLQMMYTNHLLEKKYEGMIFMQVCEDNVASMHLQKKLLIEKAEKPCYWYTSKK